MKLDEITERIKNLNKNELIQVQDAIGDRLVIIGKIEEVVELTKNMCDEDLTELQSAVMARVNTRLVENFEDRLDTSVAQMAEIALLAEEMILDENKKLAYGFGTDFKYSDEETKDVDEE